MSSYGASPAARTRPSSWRLRAAAEIERRRRAGEWGPAWPGLFSNSKTGKIYEAHTDEEWRLVHENTPRYLLLKGGEGSGKSTAGIIKVLNRLRDGMSGIMVSPDLEHFKKSLWPEFRCWCPWDCVIERHRYRQQPGWEPRQAFTLVFHDKAGGYSELLCGGAKESEIEAWEGPNVSFVHFDEARRHKTARALKVFDGRARISGPNGTPPQIFITTTPRKHWLHEYFGGARGDTVPPPEDDPFADFKRDAFVVTIPLHLNIGNLDPDYIEKRAQSLTSSEARVRIDAMWEDEEDIDKFVNVLWWDNCREALPPLRRDEPLVLALDAAKGGATDTPDCFAAVGVTRHPRRRSDVAVRYCAVWQPPPGGLLDFAPVEEEIRRLCREFSVVEIPYDPTQLHYLCTRLKNEGVANAKEFGQAKPRLVADKQLQDLVMGRRIAHDGNPLLRRHVDNADAKRSGEGGLRIVKRSESLKVDACVALSMACARCLYLNIG